MRVPMVAALGTITSAVVLLAGCTGSPAPSPSPSATAATTTTATAEPSVAPTPTAPPVPTLKPLLSADENLSYFDLLNGQVIAANAGAGGRDFIDALVAGGFARSAMQVTPDRTAVDLAADSIQWSVLFNGECLIGQYGPASGGYHGVVASPTGQGTCLVGETRPIDW